MNDQEYYQTILKRGVDLNAYGYWQQAYAKMIMFVTDSVRVASNNKSSIVVDLGCACGTVLKGFKDSKVFNEYIGIDKNKYMIDLGIKTHNFQYKELYNMDITEQPLPCEDNSVTLINCMNTLEQIPKDKIKFVINEMHRVLLVNEGSIFINIPLAKTVNEYSWWKNLFLTKFIIDENIHHRYVYESKYGPGGDNKTFHDHYKAMWTIFGLRKEK